MSTKRRGKQGKINTKIMLHNRQQKKWRRKKDRTTRGRGGKKGSNKSEKKIKEKG